MCDLSRACEREDGHAGLHMSRHLDETGSEVIDEWGDVGLRDLAGGPYLLDALGECPWPSRYIDETAYCYAFRFDGVVYLVTAYKHADLSCSRAEVREATAADLATITMVEFMTPFVVHCVHLARNRDNLLRGDDILVVINDATDLVIMEIGTTDTNEWYMEFHHRWIPDDEPYEARSGQ